MNLKDLAKQPQLIKITIDEETIVEKYGESLDFYTWDRQPMDTFLKMASSGQKDTETIIKMVKDMVLDSEGNPIITENLTLPRDVLLLVVNKIVETLGK